MSTDDRSTDEPRTSDDAADPREQARRRVERKRGFWLHLVIYIAINGLIIGIWSWTGAPFFWPVIPLVLWGVGVLANAWSAFVERPVTDERIQREINRMRR
jgi:hypothetical protein